MIEKSYGVPLDAAGAGIASRLDALDAEREEHALADAAPSAQELARLGLGHLQDFELALSRPRSGHLVTIVPFG